MDPRRIKFDEEITRLNGDHVKWYTSESIKDMIENHSKLDASSHRLGAKYLWKPSPKN